MAITKAKIIAMTCGIDCEKMKLIIGMVVPKSTLDVRPV
ncbi:hypothetical protein B834_1590 [Enterococcus mundtii 1A]|nr:hypothetical protein [Enterococcus mundtii 1A]